MRVTPSIITRIADSILRQAGDDYQYIHDPDHRSRPHGTFWPTDKGWSNDPKDATKENQQAGPTTSNPIDQEYFKAIQSGNTETVQRMVTERAKQAGYHIKGYHGTNDTFNKIDMNKGAMGSFWFAGDKESIQEGKSGASGTKNIKELYIKINNPAGWKEYDKYSKGELEREGYDGVLLKDNDDKFTGFVWKKSSQVKSADPIVKDDSGNIIPISQRFNPKSNDIRH